MNSLELSILWEDIEELPGEEILAGLNPTQRLIVMNERRRHEMEAKSGRRPLYICLSQYEERTSPDYQDLVVVRGRARTLAPDKLPSSIWPVVPKRRETSRDAES